MLDWKLLGCLVLLPASWLAADPASKYRGGHHPQPPPAEARYQPESPLPKGWPEPGPFGEVARKKYPAYRAAWTASGKPNGGFWTLFKHIERKGIPMTAPVEMKLDPASPDAARMEQMGFLYQSPEVGTPGPDGPAVEVRDLPATEALSYAWLGGRDKAAVRRARQAVDAELARLGLTAKGYRLLGYNSPFVPRARQTQELQALLP